MPSYSFDVEHAERWGVNEAIFLHNLIHWLRKNKAEGRNIQPGTDGETRVWSYSTMEALAQLYPFWKAHQVRYVIDSLRKAGVIVTDKLSKERFDRTLWFAVADETLLAMSDAPPLPAAPVRGENGEDPRFDKFRKSRSEKSQMVCEDSQVHLRKSANGDETFLKSYKDTDNNPTDSRTTYVQKEEKTFNVGDFDLDIASSLDTPTFEAIQAVIDRFDDRRSTRRFTQLRQICREHNRLGVWTVALRSTEIRMRRDDLGKLERPGAYFCAAVVRQLEEIGIVVPAGSAEERAEVSGLIAASLNTREK